MGESIDAGDILYGRTPERSLLGTDDCVLDFFSTGSFYGYYHDYEGWSGTLVWMVRQPRLPRAWLPDESLGRRLEEPPDDFLCLIQDINDGFIPDLTDAEISYHHEAVQYGPMMKVSFDEEEFEDAVPELVVPQAFLNAVEQLSDQRGSWYRELDTWGQLYYLDVDGKVLGVSWYGRTDEIVPPSEDGLFS